MHYHPALPTLLLCLSMAACNDAEHQEAVVENLSGTLTIQDDQVLLVDCEGNRFKLAGTFPQELAKAVTTLRQEPSKQRWVEASGRRAKGNGEAQGYEVEAVSAVVEKWPCDSELQGTYALRSSRQDGIVSKMNLTADGFAQLVIIWPDDRGRKDVIGRWRPNGANLELTSEGVTYTFQSVEGGGQQLRSEDLGLDIVLVRME